MDIIEKYLKWIKDNTLSDEIKEGVWKVSTPFMDRHNDHLDIYAVQQKDGTFFLTDDGYVMEDLKLSGFELNTPKRRELFDVSIKRLGVEFNERTNEIFVNTDMENLGRHKHSLIQAMIAINDMFCLSQSTVTTIFREDVKQYLEKKQVHFIQDINIMGRSGYEQNIDFAIPADNKHKERLIKSINNLNKQSIKNLIFLFIDIDETRNRPKKIVIFNDEMSHPKKSLDALNKYDIKAIPWTKIDEFDKEFALV